LKLGTIEQSVIDRCRRMNLPLPDSVANPPDLDEGLEWYLAAFEELSSDRSCGMSPGPIPGWAIRRFARDCYLAADEEDDLTYLVRRLDAAFLDHVSHRMNQKQKAPRHARPERSRSPSEKTC